MNGFLDNLTSQSAQRLDTALIRRAYDFAMRAHDGQKRESGEPYFMHSCAVASTLLDMEMDAAAISAALLHDVAEDTAVTLQEIQREFGEEIASLVAGMTKLSRVEYTSSEERQAESLRRMLLAMNQDIRVIIIKLADRLHNMRTLDWCAHDKQLRVAHETLDIYAQIANRLGMSRIKCELEDLSLKYIDPEAYTRIQTYIADTQTQRDAHFGEIMRELNVQLEMMSIPFDISGRIKHIYSIHRKMKRQSKSIDQIYDIVAIRIIVDTVRDCYGVLGTVHTMWKPLPGRFKDYIAVPKPNLYQSLHTTLIGRGGQPFEIQIRTQDMHRTAEYGIAAHWKYKEQRDQATDLDEKLTWLRSILEWQTDTRDAREFIDTLKVDLFSEEVFVFTPKGDVIDLPRGATPIDFAYAIHSAVGNRCVGAKINGRITPLDVELKTGDIVEVITSNAGHGPSRDWLKVAKTPQARTKIRAWFKREFKAENIEKGREMIEAAAQRVNVPLNELLRPEWLKKVFKRFSLNSLEDMYAAVGYGGVTTNQVVLRLLGEYRQREHSDTARLAAAQKAQERSTTPASVSHGVEVKGHKGMLVRFARCCNPVPKDDIVGFITRGRGVSVHRSDCPNLLDMGDMGNENRLIEVAWEDDSSSAYRARINITAYDRAGLLVDVSRIIEAQGVAMLEINAKITKKGVANITILLQIKDKQQLDTIMRNFKRMPETIEVYRGT